MSRITEKTERNSEMLRLYIEEHMTLETIGDLFGVTRERVRQIVSRAGVTRDVTLASMAIRRDSYRVQATCVHCGKVVMDVPSRPKRRFCSPFCRYSSPNNRLSEEWLLRTLRRLALVVGKTPRTLNFKAPWPSHTTYVSTFGSIRQAQILAGLTPNSQGGGRGQAPLPDGFREHWAHLLEPTA